MMMIMSAPVITSVVSTDVASLIFPWVEIQTITCLAEIILFTAIIEGFHDNNSRIKNFISFRAMVMRKKYFARQP